MLTIVSLHATIHIIGCGNPSLAEIIKTGSIDNLEKALQEESGVAMIDSMSDCCTPLILAVRYNQKDMVKLLLDKGANPYVSCYSDNVALRESVKLGYDEITEILITRCYGRKYDLYTNFPDTNEPRYNYLSRLGNDNYEDREKSLGYALIEAAKKGQNDKVLLLLNKGAHPNIKASNNSDFGINQTTPLIAAVSNNHIKVVKMLLELGADVNLCIRGGQLEGYRVEKSSLAEAARKGYKDIVKLLINHGANRYILDSCGYCASDYAKENGYNDIYLLLL